MNEQKVKQGSIVIVSGPSGVGKSTICRKVIERIENVRTSVSVTTRPKSEVEVDGRDYWFISRQEFQERIDKGLLLEYAEVFGNMYGTPSDKVAEALNRGETIILEIDVQGAQKVKLIHSDAVMIFILPPTHKELAERLNGRGREDSETTELRLDEADDEIAVAWQHYQHMVINDDLEQAVNEVVQIIEAARK